MAQCNVCFRHCEIKEHQTGFCKARICIDGNVVPANYGWFTACHLDPIEKKPLARFFPGSKILSVGSYGCNLRCPFCQNSEISWGNETIEMSRIVAEHLKLQPKCGEGDELPHPDLYTYTSPEKLVSYAEECRHMGSIGIAYTYNEPLIGYEYVLDTARLAHAKGMKNVLVSNGTAEIAVLEKTLPYIDAMNIDLKGFTDHYYQTVLGGNRKMVMDFIDRAVKDCHVELTTLIVPGENDTEEEMQALSAWISQLQDGQGRTIGKKIPLHVSRFFPRFCMTDRPATAVDKVYRLAEVARQKLDYVYTGNC